MESSRVKLDRMVSIVEISGVERILDVCLLVAPASINRGARPRFLSNFDALAGMSRRVAIFNSEDDSMVRAWGYVRDTKGCLEKILGMPWEEIIGKA